MGLEKIQTPKVDLLVRFQCEACDTFQTVTIDQRWDVEGFADGGVLLHFACEKCRAEQSATIPVGTP